MECKKTLEEISEQTSFKALLNNTQDSVKCGSKYCNMNSTCHQQL